MEGGDSEGRRDAYSAIVWYWRGEGLLASVSPNRQAPKALRARWPNRPPLRNRRLPHRAMPRLKRTRCSASYRIFRPRRARPRSRPSCRVNRAWRRWRQRLRAGNPASHINPSPAKDVELEKRTYFPSWIGFACMTRALLQLVGSPFREQVSTYLSAKLLLQLQPSI